MSAVAKIKDEPKQVSDARQSAGAMTPMEMLNSAIVRGDSIDKLERLMDLNDRWEKAQAKKAYIEAKAAFKANAPAITKDKKNKQYDSSYASIGNVVNTTNEELSKHGLDAGWDYDQTNGIRVTCKLTHVMGHSESVSLTGAPDASGSKNPLQQIKSTLTYLKLATFEAVTGIATKEGNVDDDGNASGGLGTISGEQVTELQALIKQVGSNTTAFLKIANAETLSDVLAKDLPGLKKVLLAKKNNGAPQ